MCLFSKFILLIIIFYCFSAEPLKLSRGRTKTHVIGPMLGSPAYMNIPLLAGYLNNRLLYMFPQDFQKQKVDDFQRGSASVDRLMILLHEGVYVVVEI